MVYDSYEEIYRILFCIQEKYIGKLLKTYLGHKITNNKSEGEVLGYFGVNAKSKPNRVL